MYYIIKKTKRYVLVLLIIALVSIGNQFAFADNVLEQGSVKTSIGTENYNIMLVIDKSGSMNGTDKEHRAQDAASMFVNSLSVSNSKVGVISFSKTSNMVMKPLEINSESQKNKLTSSIASIQYDPSGTGGTNLGGAVALASRTLQEEQENDKKNLIILFTDGYTENLSKEEEKQANKDLQQGIQIANELSCEIYVVGLNQKRSNGSDSIEKEGVRQIAYIAKETQLHEGICDPSPYDTESTGKVNYVITDSVSEIYQFYTDIFGILSGGYTGKEAKSTYENGQTIYEIPIESDTITEVNIFLVSDQGIGEFTLQNSNGEKINFDGKQAMLKTGRNYATLKVLEPEKGTWRIVVAGQVQYHVNYVVKSGVEISLATKKQEQEHTIQVEVKAFDENEPIKDASFYETLTKKQCSIQYPDGTKEENIPLSYDGEQETLIATITYEMAGIYQIQVQVQNEQFKREATTSITIDALQQETNVVKNKDHAWKIGIGIVIVAIVGGAFFVIIRRKTRKLEGEFYVTVSNEDNAYEREYTIPTFKGSVFTVWDIMKRAIEPEQLVGEDEKLLECIEQAKPNLKKIKVLIVKQKRQRRVVSVYKYRPKNGKQAYALSGEVYYGTEEENYLCVSIQYHSSDWQEEEDNW